MQLFKKFGGAWLLAAILAGCGGGGGGSDGPGGTSTLSDVNVTLDAGSSIVAEVIDTDFMVDKTLQATVTGNVASLTGTIYTLVEDPDSFYQSPFVSVTTVAPYRATLTLRGKKLSGVGKRTGNLKIYVCLDSACRTQLGGSPLVVPYSVDVVGLSLNTEAITLNVPFGQTPVVPAITATAGKGMLNLSARVTTPYDSYSSTPVLTASSAIIYSYTPSAGPVTATIPVRVLPMQAGTRTDTVTVSANFQNANGNSVLVTKVIAINYTVTPDPSVDYVFAPQGLNFDRTLNDPLIREHGGRSLVLNAGVTATWKALEYLGNPPAAAGHPAVNMWWNENLMYSAVCVGSCLPAGTYTARVRYTISKGGVDTDIYFPITMNVVP
ncbi:MAG: hypothetical protein EOO28_15965 [Comamonadaceae bacterium]|nr:MAG: hypothetical protein EOO28_15965 [Comamonadaceae bacterium]